MTAATDLRPSSRQGSTEPASRAAERMVALPAARRAFLVLAGIATSFALATLALHLIELSSTAPAWLSRLDTGAEANAPTWFSSAMLLAAAGLSLAFAAGARAQRLERHERWAFVGVGLLLASMDEEAQVHEALVGPLVDGMRALVGEGVPARALAVLAALVAMVALLAWLSPWLRSLPRGLRRALVLSALVYGTGALGLEVVARVLDTAVGNGSVSRAGEFLSVAEELCEMLGVALFISALLAYVPAILVRPHGGAPPGPRSSPGAGSQPGQG